MLVRHRLGGLEFGDESFLDRYIREEIADDRSVLVMHGEPLLLFHRQVLLAEPIHQRCSCKSSRDGRGSLPVGTRLGVGGWLLHRVDLGSAQVQQPVD